MTLITWDVVNKGAAVVLSNDNLTASGVGQTSTVRASLGKTIGKWYWEIKVNTNAFPMIGIANSSANLNAIHTATTNIRYYYYSGVKYAGGTAYGASYTTGDTIGIALDLDIGTITFYKNGVSQGVAWTDIKTMGEVFPAVSGGSGNTNVVTANFGATQFAYPVPVGYKPYYTKPNKTLIQLSNGEVKYFNITWKTLTTGSPTKVQFETYGIEDLSVVTKEQWTELNEVNVKLLTYVPTVGKLINFNKVTEGKSLIMNALPDRQFIKLTTPKDIYGLLQDFKSTEVNSGYNNGVIRYLLSTDRVQWKKWNGMAFVNTDASTKQLILKNGMTLDEINKLTTDQWELWGSKKLYVGIYLEDDIREKHLALVDSMSYVDLAPKETTKISDAKLYILNTTSTINVTFTGSTVTGTIDDGDKGKVQYRVLLNGNPYYPADASFTQLVPSPLDIGLTLSNDDILIDQNNKLRIEFQDYWGATDYWETNFIGTYSGLLFLDQTGQYYSTDVGEILQYLDFGVIIAGQTTIEQAIVLKNTYGYAVENINIKANQSKFPVGMKVQFGTSSMNFEALDELDLNVQLQDGDETTFYIRLTTQLGITPQANGEFDILVKANKVVV